MADKSKNPYSSEPKLSLIHGQGETDDEEESLRLFRESTRKDQIEFLDKLRALGMDVSDYSDYLSAKPANILSDWRNSLHDSLNTQKDEAGVDEDTKQEIEKVKLTFVRLSLILTVCGFCILHSTLITGSTKEAIEEKMRMQLKVCDSIALSDREKNVLLKAIDDYTRHIFGLDMSKPHEVAKFRVLLQEQEGTAEAEILPFERPVKED